MRCCEPCRNRVTMSCDSGPDIRVGECVYPSAYMVTWAGSIKGKCNCYLEGRALNTGKGSPYDDFGIFCCDRNARLQNQFSGTFILAHKPLYVNGQLQIYWNYEYLLDTYESFILNGMIRLRGYQASINFRITDPISRAFTCGPVATLSVIAPPWGLPCSGASYSGITDIPGMGANYACYQVPGTCDGSWTMELGSGFGILPAYQHPCWSVPVSVVVSPVLEEE
jgi:hypothetical protein